MRLILLMMFMCFGPLPAFAWPFSIQGETLYYNTERDGLDGIEFGDAEKLLEILKENKKIKLIKLESEGGVRLEAKYMADIILDANLDTHVDKQCSSACIRLLLAGTKRTANLGVKIGFHRGTWSAENMEKYYDSKKEKYGWKTPFDFSSWVYDLVQTEVHELTTYLRSRGVSSYISDKTYRLGENEMWFPRMNELLSSGILTE
jgi:hypothetical protein